MPSAVPTRIRRTALAVAAAGMAVPAVASAACPSTPSAQVFAQWGDTAQYSLLSGGHFEGGAPGWNISSGAAFTAGNEPWKVAGAGHATSLTLRAGATVTSPAFCIGYEQPTFRFFIRKAGAGAWGGVSVKVRWKDSAGIVWTVPLGRADVWNSTSWAPTAVLPLGRSLPLWQGGHTLTAQLIFEGAAFGADMAIDDVYVDPYMRG